MASNDELWCFLWCQPEGAVEQKSSSQWSVMRSLCRHSNDMELSKRNPIHWGMGCLSVLIIFVIENWPCYNETALYYLYIGGLIPGWHEPSDLVMLFIRLTWGVPWAANIAMTLLRKIIYAFSGSLFDMETISALLALCEMNPPMTGWFRGSQTPTNFLIFVNHSRIMC